MRRLLLITNWTRPIKRWKNGLLMVVNMGVRIEKDIYTRLLGVLRIDIEGKVDT